MSRLILIDIENKVEELNDMVKRMKYYMDELGFEDDEDNLSDDPILDLFNEFEDQVVKLPTRLRIVDVGSEE